MTANQLRILIWPAFALFLAVVVYQWLGSVDGPTERPAARADEDGDEDESVLAEAETYSFTMNLEADGQGGWVCSVRGREFRDADALGAFLAAEVEREAEPGPRGLLLVGDGVDTVSMVTVAMAGTASGLAAVRTVRAQAPVGGRAGGG
jgi:hypothetical protein